MPEWWREGGNPSAEYPRFQGSPALGKSGPKARQKCVVDGQQVDSCTRNEQNCSDTEGKTEPE